MRLKYLVILMVLLLALTILLNNHEESTFWLFGEIRTSKLYPLGAFFLLGLMSGGFLFRRRKRTAEPSGIYNPQVPADAAELTSEGSSYRNTLSDEDREYLSRD